MNFTEVDLQLILHQLRSHPLSYDEMDIGVHSDNGRVLLYPAQRPSSSFASWMHASRPGVAIKAYTPAVNALPTRFEDIGIPVVEKLTPSTSTASTAPNALIVREESALLLWSETVDRIAQEFIALDHQLRHRVGICHCDRDTRIPFNDTTPARQDVLASAQYVPSSGGKELGSLTGELPDLSLSFEFTEWPESYAYEERSLLIDGTAAPPSFEVNDITDSFGTDTSSYGITPEMIQAAALSPWRGSSSLAAQLAEHETVSTASSVDSWPASHDAEPRTISPSLLYSPYTPLSLLSPAPHSPALASPTAHDLGQGNPSVQGITGQAGTSSAGGDTCPETSPLLKRNDYLTPSVRHLSPRTPPDVPMQGPSSATASWPPNAPEVSDEVRRKRKRSPPPPPMVAATTTRSLRPRPGRTSQPVVPEIRVACVVQNIVTDTVDEDSDMSELDDSDADAEGSDDDEYDPPADDGDAPPDDEYELPRQSKRRRLRNDEDEREASGRTRNTESMREPLQTPPRCCTRRRTKASMNSNGEHMCQWCKARFTRKHDLDRHQRNVDLTVQCGKCGKLLARKDSMLRHQRGTQCHSHSKNPSSQTEAEAQPRRASRYELRSGGSRRNRSSNRARSRR